MRCPPECSSSRGRLVDQGSYRVDDDFAMGVIRNTSRGPDSIVLGVERDEDAPDPLDRDGPVGSPLDHMNVTIGHALAVPVRSAVQTLDEPAPGRADELEAIAQAST